MQQKNLIVILIVFLIACSTSGYLFWRALSLQSTYKYIDLESPSPSVTSQVLGQTTKKDDTRYEVTRVVDGDTIEINYLGKPSKLRYIGINTPETVDPRRPVQCFGKEASNENRSLVQGKSVILERDVSDTDKFGRLLRYVYLKLENGSTLFVNDYLVRAGFAQVDTFPPDVKYVNRLLAAESEARSGNKGLWGICSTK